MLTYTVIISVSGLHNSITTLTINNVDVKEINDALSITLLGKSLTIDTKNNDIAEKYAIQKLKDSNLLPNDGYKIEMIQFIQEDIIT